jgi:alkanesulfonate monooxygenase SsuD/methylene tetrahydromethanopterin reductase-like flavin-dependent oxidoreductase (luciferase family)
MVWTIALTTPSSPSDRAPGRGCGEDGRVTTSAVERIRAAHHWAILPSGSRDAVGGHVARLAATGARGLVVPQIFAPPWATLGAAAMAGELDLASGIALGFVRSPMETAMAALDLDRLCDGRFTLGLGSSTQVANEDRFGVPYDKPVSRLRELTELVHRMVTADEQAGIGRFEGEFWHVDLTGVRLPRPVRPSIPIYLAPLRTTMTEMAAEVADGIFGHPVWSPRWITGEVRAAVERGLANAGRARADFRVTAWLRVVITDDHDAGVRDAKAGIPFYAGLRQYESYFDAIGVGDDARVLMDLSESGAPPADLAAAVSDGLVEELVPVGTPEEVAERIAPVLEVADELLLAPPNGLSGERTRAYEAAIAEHLLPGAG